jgi:hypothetical protein
LEEQLRSSNDKLTAANNQNLSLEMGAAQSNSKISQLEQKISDLNQDLAALQKYRSDSDGFINQDRARVVQLESRLTGAEYELEKIQR